MGSETTQIVLAEKKEQAHPKQKQTNKRKSKNAKTIKEFLREVG